MRYTFADALGAPPISASAGAHPARAGDDAPPTPRSPHGDPREDPAYARDMVAEILGTLRDDHSTAFYLRVVRTLPEELLRHVLESVRQSVREGLAIDAARKTFTAAVRARAKAAGLTL